MADRTVVGGGGHFTYDWASNNPISVVEGGGGRWRKLTQDEV
jgi:hypothetical protein